MTTRSGVRLAPASPAGALRRVGIWAPEQAAPLVLTEDEIAVALAHSGCAPGPYGILVDDAARLTLAGVEDLGRGTVAVLAERWRDQHETEVFPPGSNSRYLRGAADLCRKVHRDPDATAAAA
ncbi:hypothetical protein [Amycolatopsis sp. NPDC059021]|uniref:hypothetical protein n=1 Tax=Amycolatopsis sp. NPDC059021 TaxID=3346704 RepID=UPI00366BF1E0